MTTLFDRYLNQNLMSPPPQGLGLGLPWCRSIALRQGGSVMAESRPGQGARFTISLPNRQEGTAGISDVSFGYAGTFNRSLVRLSDALPKEAFLIRNQD